MKVVLFISQTDEALNEVLSQISPDSSNRIKLPHTVSIEMAEDNDKCRHPRLNGYKAFMLFWTSNVDLDLCSKYAEEYYRMTKPSIRDGFIPMPTGSWVVGGVFTLEYKDRPGYRRGPIGVIGDASVKPVKRNWTVLYQHGMSQMYWDGKIMSDNADSMKMMTRAEAMIDYKKVCAQYRKMYGPVIAARVRIAQKVG